MREISETPTKHLSSGGTKKSLALTSFILGIIPLVFLILAKLNLPIPELFEIIGLLALFAPVFAIIYGIIALTEKENKPLSLTGIVLGILALSFFVSSLFFAGPTPLHSAATKVNLAGLKAGISICCANDGNLQNLAGSDMCSPSIHTILPTHRDLELRNAADLNYAVTAQCDAETPTIIVTIKNHPKENCDGVWTISEAKLIIPPGC